MKKLLSLMLVSIVMVGLAGCDFAGEVPEEVIDCLTNPDGEGCPDINPLVCTGEQVLEDGVCVDPDPVVTCTGDQVLEDGVCVDPDPDLVCTGDQIIEDGVCVDPDPDPLVCTGDQVIEDGVCVDPVVVKTPAELLAEAVVANWDGDLSHLELLMDSLDLETSMEFILEFNMEVTDFYDEDFEETHFINVVITDNYQYLETGTLMHRNMAMNLDDEVHFIDFMFEEVDTGVIVYMNIEDIKASLVTEGPEVLEYLNTLGATQNWLMFRFDDTLDNVIELEVMKSMVADIFFLQMGETFFYDLQGELDMELGVVLADYDINLGLLMDYLVDENYTAAETMLENIDYETLVFDLDAIHLVPELVMLLNEYKTELDFATFNTDARVAFLLANGTEAFLEDLTDAEIVILLDILVDAPNMDPEAPDFSEMYEAYLVEELDHFIVMFMLDKTDVQMALGDIPGLNFTVFYNAMNDLDYDAFYLETIDVEALGDAIYAGQDAFDIYVIALNATAPETASILAAFSYTVYELEEFMVIIDDINYVFDNLYLFEDYLDIQYYLDNDMVVYDLEITDDFDIETTIMLQGNEASQLFIDLLDEVYWFLDDMESFEMPFLEHINCPVDELDCDPFPDYLPIIADLDEFGYIEIVALYNPLVHDEMSMVIDLTNFAQALNELGDESGTINNISIKMIVKEVGSVTLPTETADVNQIAQDFAKVSLNFMTYDFVREALEYYADNQAYYQLHPTELLGNHALDTYDNMTPSYAFDSNMSYITVGGSLLNPTISCTLYWADGTLVFTEPITLDYLDDMMLDGIPSAADYQTLLSKVDDDNWNMSKMIIVFLFSDWDNGNQEDEYYPVY